MKIVVNGKHVETSDTSLSYADVVQLAGLHNTPSVTWRVRGGLAGIMHPGGAPVAVVDGLVLSVVHTGDA